MGRIGFLACDNKRRYSESRYTIGGRTENKHTYVGGSLNDAGGPNYYRHRMYHAQLGRFVSRDPIGYWANSINLYEYAFDSPTNGTDPSGLQFIPFKIPEPILQIVRPLFPKPKPRRPVLPPPDNFDKLWPPNPPILPGGDARWNCYNYACDRMRAPFPRFWQPGETIGLSPQNFLKNCHDLVNTVKRERGGILSPWGPCPDGYHGIRIWLNPGKDFHFYREDPISGEWSDKAGRCQIRPRLPRPTEYKPGYENCGDLCVPN